MTKPTQSTAQTANVDALNAIARASGRLDRYTTPEDRFLSRIEVTDGCWKFRGGSGLSGNNYTTIKIGARYIYAHRFAYELFVGPIPDGMQIDHSCLTKRCVRPDHLSPVTGQENVRRYSREQRTMCRNGLHDVSESVLLHPWKNGPRKDRAILRCVPCYQANLRRVVTERRRKRDVK